MKNDEEVGRLTLYANEREIISEKCVDFYVMRAHKFNSNSYRVRVMCVYMNDVCLLSRSHFVLITNPNRLL